MDCSSRRRGNSFGETMIHSVEIPTTTGRIPTSPYPDADYCCDDCRSGQACGSSAPPAAADCHRNGVRNSALRGVLGLTQCDPDGNCWTDGVLTAAPLTTGLGCPVGVPVCNATPATSSGELIAGISNNTLYLAAGGLILLLALTSGSGRR